MGALGLALWWFGYWVAFYGYDQLQGGNNSFVSLGVPGKFKNAAKDAGGNAQAAANSAAAVKLQTLQGQQSAGLTTAGGAGSAQAGTGIASAPGGVTVVLGVNGEKACLDHSGAIVPCPPGA